MDIPSSNRDTWQPGGTFPPALCERAMGRIASPARPTGPKQLPSCAATVSVIYTTNSTRITRGQEKEGALYFPLTFSSVSITWIFDWGVAMPVCRLPYLYATALSSEV